MVHARRSPDSRKVRQSQIQFSAAVDMMHGRIVGQHDRVVEIIEVLGVDGTPPYRVRSQDGHESLMNPGPDSVVQQRDAASPDS